MSVTEPSTRKLRKSLTVAAACAATALTFSAAAPTQADDTPKLREGGVPEALWNYVSSPGAVPGANDWSCRPSAEHPEPVVMLPGTFFNLGANFVKAAPRLKNAGYCVYALNYGSPSAASAGSVPTVNRRRSSTRSWTRSSRPRARPR
ncbi:hypothetical protein ABZ930_01480 [Streptomyces sp. NPDC046716]|uniref:esterase/lipase family protein n=1 Tax=Streptomyces sp. NPDC046716 TaxID=3157093 RepID=UPI0033E968FB